MKALKLALIGSAALAAASVSARADDLNALKAQIETLNARVASLEATPAVPAGYQAVSFTKNENGEHVISIMPTADAPAAATIVWSGWVRGAVTTGYNPAYQFTKPALPGTAGVTGKLYATDVRAAAGLKVVGTTDTAVGEVGVSIALKETASDVFGNGILANNGGNPGLISDGFFGWWKMTPSLSLKAGVFGSLAKNSYTFDAVCSCYYTDAFGGISGGAFTNDPAQIQLAYADGPLSFAIGVEDSNNGYNAAGTTTGSSAVGVTGNAAYKADMFGFDLSGGYWGDATGKGPAAWVVSAGLGAKFDIISLGAAVGFGHSAASVSAAPALVAGADYTKASGYAIASLSDAASIQLGVAHNFTAGAESTEYDAGLYYTPVKQLTLGAEGMYIAGGGSDGRYTAALLSIFRF